MNTIDERRVILALHNDSRRLENAAKSRASAGPKLAGYREGLRREAEHLDHLADAIRAGLPRLAQS